MAFIFETGTQENPASFRVETHKYGKLVYGYPTLDEVDALLQLWEKEAKKIGLTAVVYPGIAAAYRADLAVAYDYEKWIDEIELTLSDKGKELKWALGPHCGISSMTIFTHLATDPTATEVVKSGLMPWGEGDLPHDVWDWLRCYRCIVECDFESRLDELAKADPRWVHIVKAWPDLKDATSKYLNENDKAQKDHWLFKATAFLNEALMASKTG